MKAKKEKPGDRIARIYGRACHGVQVPIMSLGAVMRVGEQAVREGLDDEAVGKKLREAADAVRTN